MSEKQDKWVEIQKLSSRVNEIRGAVEVFDKRITSYNAGRTKIIYGPYDDYNFSKGLSDYLIEIIEEELEIFMPVVFQRAHDRLNKQIEDKKEEIKKLVEVEGE